MKIQDMLSTGVGVRLVSKVEILVDHTEMNCWKKRREKERLRSQLSTTIFFTGKQRHVSSSGLSRQQVWSNGSVVNGKVPQHTPFHFLLVSSKILVFAESFSNAMMNRSSATSFSLGGLDLRATSSPKRFEWAKMNLNTGAAVNTFPLDFGPEGAGDESFYCTASCDCIRDCGCWQCQSYGENGPSRPLEARTATLDIIMDEKL